MLKFVTSVQYARGNGCGQTHRTAVFLQSLYKRYKIIIPSFSSSRCSNRSSRYGKRNIHPPTTSSFKPNSGMTNPLQSVSPREAFLLPRSSSSSRLTSLLSMDPSSAHINHGRRENKHTRWCDEHRATRPGRNVEQQQQP